MSEETLVESTATEEVQAKAEKLGWIPPSRFKGDPERFIDAEDYIERGETILPIVKETNKRLERELENTRAESAKLAESLKKAQDAIDQIEERHSVATQKAVEKAREDLKIQLAAASEAGDHAGVAEITSKMVDLIKAEDSAKEEKDVKVPDKVDTFVPQKDLLEWNAENPWFGKNTRKTALALGIAQELREGGETSTGKTFFDKVTVELNKELGITEDSRTDKVEGARGGAGDTRQSGGGKKSFASLPAEAKAACDADARNFVGPNKKYKTQAEWRSRYAELYFQE